MYILGISAFYHDSAACLIKDGTIVFAAQEERFSRKKNDESFPSTAILEGLKLASISQEEVDYVVFYEKPFPKFERLLETYFAFAPAGFSSFKASIVPWIKDKLFLKRKIIDSLESLFGSSVDWGGRLKFSDHHLSHAASAFYPSPFQDAAILTIDGVGEWSTTTIAIGSANDLEISKEIKFPHSLGLLYSAFTQYLGFRVNSGEYKLMGLAPYGEPVYADDIKRNLLEILDDGSFRLNMQYFDYCTGLSMINSRFETLFGGKTRVGESEITVRHANLAASIQHVLEEVVVKVAAHVAKETGIKNLCLAGGVALNCVANSAIRKQGIFENIWVQPAAGDAGGAIGAALLGWHMMLSKDRHPCFPDGMSGSYLGPIYDETQIKQLLDQEGVLYERLDDQSLCDRTATYLAAGESVGWFQGRMEFGPRALGHRSILADPRSDSMQRQLNLKIKFRESFRPFAPSVLEEHAEEWFDFDQPSPYMTFVANVSASKLKPRKAGQESTSIGGGAMLSSRSLIPAVTHVDNSARLQTVSAKTNPLFHSLISAFYKRTGCPALVNTSFNVRGEPIVCSPKDAYQCFLKTNLDVLVLGNYLVRKIGAG